MNVSAAVLLFATLSLGSVGPPRRAPDPPPPGEMIAQFSIHEHVIIRIPAHRSGHGRREPEARPHVYREKHGPRCLPAGAMAGAAVSSPNSVDFIQKGGERFRAKLDRDCPALDYYSGFYLTPGQDGRICADRDAIRTRSGGDCQIDLFKRLVPAKP